MTGKNILIKDQQGNSLYPQTQASLVIGGLSYEDLNEEIETNPTDLIEQWQAYRQYIETSLGLYRQQIDTLRTQLNEVRAVRYVVETWQDGVNWYTVYSDGWCEQGGHLGTASANNYTVTFHKEFRDTNISVLAQDGTGTTTGTDTDGVDYCILVTNVTTSSFRVSIATGRQNSSWEAKGYIL